MTDPAQPSTPDSEDETQPGDVTSPEDETKRRFREALEAKKQRHGESHVDDGQQHVHAHGPVDAKRVFRRKTG